MGAPPHADVQSKVLAVVDEDALKGGRATPSLGCQARLPAAVVVQPLHLLLRPHHASDVREAQVVPQLRVGREHLVPLVHQMHRLAATLAVVGREGGVAEAR
eukprot:CAMPEP_0196701788 /NCGR_PEP_ID=MMETSP1090-20130531/52232_1 /TAXON_ID=37098 /ORGANISM="Isochrysis sp, Strain CCMP1244" /LENGTH=101 /DNA_ID=CAMNT_0042041579 /DNA_START=165 /DNA_END=468 /DNA_ORIENTATION=-